MGASDAARRQLALVGMLVGLVVSATACDDARSRAAGEVGGTWALVVPAGETVYLVITEDSIVEFEQDPIADCFVRVDYEIVDVDGDRFRLETTKGELTVRMRRVDDELVVETQNTEQRYEGSSVNPATLTLCEPANPGADCATLPSLVLDATIEGTVASGDDENPNGTHYDLYRFEPLAADSFHIAMDAEPGVDGYLILFDAAGNWLLQNDDRSDRTLDARIASTLEAACYVVMATTAFPDQFGDYDLSVTRQ